MRKGDILFALLLLAVAIITMFEAAKLRIGWVPGAGPGGGAFPFWIAALMALLCIIIILRALFGHQMQGPFFVSREGARTVIKVALLFSAAVASISILGFYGAMFALFLIYLKGLGRHKWSTTILVAILVPLGLYLFFDVFLLVPLPKGMLEFFFY
ncbi:MAG: tripartite tricarboxylate transporter TctB family protein [Nitrospinota bacterium]|nr:MAG: tripartite tricarboxylate transporter TctB family protein [Nitrospinota bacterium]